MFGVKKMGFLGLYGGFLSEFWFFVGKLQKRLVFWMEVVILRDSLFCGLLVWYA
jgi:hypothetical protein